MSGRPLNDEEVISEMNKMVAFIKQEAMEKAREISVKADEEFAIEKAKLVKQEQQAIDAQYEKKQKAADVSQKIAQSTLNNKSRLKLLHLREQYVQDLFNNARTELTELPNSPDRYVQFLQGVIIQGLLQLLEPSVRVVSREKDLDVVKDAAERAKEQYKDISGRDVQVDVEAGLGDEGSGGVKLISGTDRITLDNTLDERLRLLEERMLPEIRADLFGANPNRKFFT